MRKYFLSNKPISLATRSLSRLCLCLEKEGASDLMTSSVHMKGRHCFTAVGKTRAVPRLWEGWPLLSSCSTCHSLLCVACHCALHIPQLCIQAASLQSDVIQVAWQSQSESQGCQCLGRNWGPAAGAASIWPPESCSVVPRNVPTGQRAAVLGSAAEPWKPSFVSAGRSGHFLGPTAPRQM